MGVSKVIINTDTIVDLTNDTVVANKLVSSYTAHGADGEAVTGSITSKTAATYTPTTTDQTIAAGQYLAGAQTISGDANLLSENIKENVTIFGVTGSLASGGAVGKTVKFYDYDGTVLYSYTPTEFAALSAMPSNPSHTGLTAQGWNWSLSDAKAYVATYKALNIGQMYVTTDGKTRLYISIPNAKLCYIKLNIGSTGSATIDWGDGSATDTVTGSGYTSRSAKLHTYSAVGNYVITLTRNSGYIVFYNSSTSYHILSGGINTSTSIGGRNYAYTTMLTKIEFGEYVLLNYNAFNYCMGLETVTMPQTIYCAASGTLNTKLPNSAFYHCYNLKSITIPTSITALGETLLYGCYNLTSVSIPSTVTAISSDFCIYCNNLDSVTIPVGLTTLNANAFSACYRLKNVVLPSSITSIGSYAFQYCYDLRTLDLSHMPTTSTFGAYAFSNGSSLTSITFPETVGSISNNMLSGCTGLQELILPKGITSIPGSCMYECVSLRTVEIPNSVTSIGDSAFYHCYSLGSIDIPSGVTSIGSSAFNSCKALKSLNFPQNITTINTYTCYGCSALESINIPSGVTSIAGNAFYGCTNMKSIGIPSTVTSIGSNAFQNCYSLQAITIPTGVTQISGSVFYCCYSLSVVTIPATVTSIAANAFYNCYGLHEIHFLATSPATVANSSVWTGLPTYCKIYVPTGYLSAYTSATNYPSSSTYTYIEE